MVAYPLAEAMAGFNHFLFTAVAIGLVALLELVKLA
jgi:methyl-accepting chemotaxis protein